MKEKRQYSYEVSGLNRYGLPVVFHSGTREDARSNLRYLKRDPKGINKGAKIIQKLITITQKAVR